MSKFIKAAKASHSLSLAAMEEASRQGLRDANIEHLFLALIITGQPAGRAIRGLGITLDDARDAVRQQHEAQLALLGIHAELPTPGRIVFHETRGYEWSQRASDLIVRASGKGRDGDATSILQELLIEPSGLIADLLERLGTTPATVLEAVDRADTNATTTGALSARVRGRIASSTEVFVPAPVEDVWALLSDPARIREWDPGVGSVDNSNDEVLPGTTWTGYAPDNYPDGKRSKIRDEFRRKHIELVSLRRPEEIAWRVTYPDTHKSRPTLTEFVLAPTVGGTVVVVTLSWFLWQGWRRFLGIPLRPANKFVLWITLAQIDSAISRVFR
jgi:uncharacterized protein YndB with AHSA1/START domain